MRIAGLGTIKTANKFFNDVFLPEHIERFAVEALEQRSAFLPIHPSVNLDDQFYMLEKRAIKNDHTFSLNKKIYDINHKEGFDSCRKIEIRGYPNGKIRYFIDDKEVEIEQAIENAA